MLRFRGSRLFLVFTFVLAMATAGFAWPPGGNGGGNGGGGSGGGGEDPPPEALPVTYMIYWADDFRVQELNNQNDMWGQSPQGPEISYAGSFYPIGDFFADADISLRFVFGLSDRAGDGSVYLCDSCDTPDGVRGWVMCLTPDSNGDLQRTEFSIAPPVGSDDATALYSVNSWGEAGGISTTFADQDNPAAIYFTPETGTTSIGGPTWYSDHTMTESGAWIGVLEEVDGSFAHYSWTPDDGLQFMVDGVEGDGDYVNNLGHMVGFVTSYTTKRNTTTQTVTNVFFDGALTNLDVRDHAFGPFMTGINDFDDYLVERVEQGKGQAPDYHSGTLYLADIDQEFALDDMLDPANSQMDLDVWFGAESKSFEGLNNAGVIAGFNDSDSTGFVLVPVTP